MDTERIDYQRMIPAWLRQVRAEDLPEVYQEMAAVVGVEATLRLAQVYAGTSVYFPKLERALLGIRNRVIRREFDGANIRELARRWGLSARHVRHIVNPPGPRAGRTEAGVRDRPLSRRVERRRPQAA
jgi:Mor family transcriptional regulator